MALSKGMLKFYQYLRTQKVGAIVSEQEICAAGAWKPASFRTYLGKHKLDSLLAKEGVGHYRILKAGPTLSEDDVEPSMTQVAHDSAPPPIAKGQVLTGTNGNYTLVAPLGNGAVGHVWSASQSRSPKQNVACKIVSPRADLIEPTVFGNVVKRFRREANHGQKLSHDAVVRYLDMGDDAHGRPFLVMELANGSIADSLKAKKRLDENSARLAIKRIAEGLKYLHALSVVHRDVKPANLLEMDRGLVLGDFGIVKWDEFSKAFTSANTITRNSVQLGSWYYMSPEQLETPHNAVPASDIYALGVTWYELLTGVTPAPTMVAAGRAPPPSTNDAVNALIRNMTSYDAHLRPTAAQLIDSL